MWILPNKRVINFPRPIKVNDVNHPADIFTKWSPEELAKIGIKSYKEQKYDRQFYRSVASWINETDTVVSKSYTLVSRFTNNELKKKMNVKVKAELKQLFLDAQKELDFLEEFDITNNDIEDLTYYRTELKNAYADIRFKVKAIKNYDELVAYNWRTLYPVDPTAEEAVS